MMGSRPGMTFKQSERATGMLTACMSAKDVARHFQRHKATISPLLNRFLLTWNVPDRPRSGRLRKTTLREDRFLTTSSRHNRFLSTRKLGRLQRNATCTRVCDRTVRDRIHAARLKDANGPGSIRAGLAVNGATFCFRTNPGLTCHLLIEGFEHGGDEGRG